MSAYFNHRHLHFMLFAAFISLVCSMPAKGEEKMLTDSVIMEILRHEGTDGIKGIWQSSAGGSSVAILPLAAWERRYGKAFPQKALSLSTDFIIVLLDSPSPRLQPGTIMGWAVPAAKPGMYEAIIYTKEAKFKLTGPKKFVMQLADDGHLSLRAIHKGVIINPWRFLPYMIRGAIKFRDDTPQDMNGFFRIWPVPSNPHQPRYL